jgi:plasmid stabilization system protein ParE
MYDVRWKRSAVSRLAQLWLEASDRSAVTEAVDRIDRQLAIDPQHAGESRSGDIRVLFEPPVGVFFEVEEHARAVHVLRVWTF